MVVIVAAPRPTVPFRGTHPAVHSAIFPFHGLRHYSCKREERKPRTPRPAVDQVGEGRFGRSGPSIGGGVALTEHGEFRKPGESAQRFVTAS